MQWEASFMEALQKLLNPVTEHLAVIFTYFGEEVVLVAVLGFIYWCRDKEMGKFLGTNLVAVLAFGPMVKNAILRPRPYMEYSTIQCVRPVESGADIYNIAAQGYSCPSGHAACSTVLYGSLAKYKKGTAWLTVLAIVLPLLCGLSRVFLGVHYPTDVLLGYALGTLVLFLVSYFQQFREKRWVLQTCLFAATLTGLLYCRSDDYFTALGVMAGLFLSMPFEEKYVKFENTRSVWRSIVRLILGFALYFGLNTGLKAVLPALPGMGGMLLRSLRYAVVIFILFGLYPYVFRLPDSLRKKKSGTENFAEYPA